MTTLTGERPPYLAALGVFGLVLAGYVATLAPSVTFWDAGELIAASRMLGIPHPPGTPLFVMMAHVWASLIPFGEYAWRTNLMSASFSAAGAGLWFLIAHASLRGAVAGLDARAGGLLRSGGAVAAALVAAFGFTQWQNSNETEVYAVATFTIALVGWLALRWRANRGTPAASKALLLAVYLGGLSMGNHLLALLVGPALVGYLVAVLVREPAADQLDGRREWGETAVVAGVWALLIGTGLGSTALVTMGAACFGAAAVFARRQGVGRFALLTLVFASIGITVYLFMYIRAGQHPIVNEADPSTWQSLLAVIRRDQYPVRTPLDDPTVQHSPDNPGRTLVLVGLQLLSYLQYFDWQWAKSVTAMVGAFPLRTLATLLFFWLGFRGLLTQRRTDRTGWWLLSLLFLTTGLGLVAYMNFKPGFSVGYQFYSQSEDHEVRERDYFFVVSFVVWGIWAGMGLVAVARRAIERWQLAPAVASLVFGVALVPLTLNFTEASRRHGADARLAGDFAYDLLNSVPPYGILFTFGDNDTFPVWWAQEVAGTRQDVTVICLALAETDWYMRQLREQPTRPFDEATAPVIWRGRTTARPDWPLHTMTDEEIVSAVPQYLPADVELRFGEHQVTFPRNTIFYGKDFLSVRVIQQNFGRRPIAWALTAGGQYYRLDRFLAQQGLAIRIIDAPPDSTSGRYDFRRIMGAPLDLAVTDSLLFQTYRYGDVLTRGAARLETTARSTAGTLAVPFTQMAYAAEARGDAARMIRYLEPAARLSTNPAIRQALTEVRESLPAKRP